MGLFEKIWKNKIQILEGLKNNTFKNDDIEKLAEQRRSICGACEHYDTVGSGCLIPGTQPCCSHCGCSLKLKTRSLSSKCPIDKWGAVLSEDEAFEHIDIIEKLRAFNDSKEND